MYLVIWQFFLGFYPKVRKRNTHKKTCKTVYSSFGQNSQSGRSSNVSNRITDQQTVLSSVYGVLQDDKKEWTTKPHNNATEWVSKTTATNPPPTLHWAKEVRHNRILTTWLHFYEEIWQTDHIRDRKHNSGCLGLDSGRRKPSGMLEMFYIWLSC